jgi:O-antigen ligase
MRHEVVGAVLTAIFLSMTATRLRPFRSTPTRIVYRCSLVVGTLMILLSLSRAVIVAAAAIPLLATVRSLASGRLSSRQLAAGAGTVVAGLVLGVTGIAAVIGNRFLQDTSSYEARDQLLHQAFGNIGEHALTGGVVTLHHSSHNIVLDSWLRAGVFGALFAAAVLVWVVGLWLALVLDLPRAPDWMFPVTAALALPVVRMLTAGAGVILPVEWVCLAIVVGFLAARRSPVDPRVSAKPDR